MAKTEVLPKEVLNAIAKKVGADLDKVLSGGLGGAGGHPVIRETFGTYVLEGVNVVAPTDDLIRLTRNLGIWHHQISVGGNVVAYARTKPLGATPDSWSVRELSDSVVARKIDDAVAWIDANVEGNYTARLLTVPAYNVFAFLLFDENHPEDQKVVVVSAPGSLSALTTQKVYTNKQFLDALRSSRHIVGLAE